MLKDKGVLALVKKKAAEQEGRESDQQWDMKEIVTYVSDCACTCRHMLSSADIQCTHVQAYDSYAPGVQYFTACPHAMCSV